METQEDSIDIARLQRVALGLESQPYLVESGLNEKPSHHGDQLGQLQLDNHELTSDGKGFSNKAPPKTRLEYKGGRENAFNSLDTKSSPSERIPLTSPILRPEKMVSADSVPSDTQVISQSVYDEVIRRNKEAGNSAVGSDSGDRATLMTLPDGDSGRIDLLSGFDGASLHAVHTDENEEQTSSKLGDSSPLSYEPNIFPESQRFVTKSPATVVKNIHSESASIVSPLISRNPLASDLASGGGIMALSQVFKATQAPSSPLVSGLQSDLLSDKPSPNIPIQSRPLATSLSSPYNTIAASFPRDSSESQLNYVTMKESQANRDNILKDRMTRSANDIYLDEQSDGEFDKEPSFIERRRRQKKIDEEATAQFATLKAPARVSSRHRRQADSSITSLPEEPERPPQPILVEDELQGPAPELQHGGTSEEETEQEEDLPEHISRTQNLNSSTEEDKENCNDLSTNSLAHTTSAHDRLSQALSLHDSPLSNKGSVQRPTNPHFHNHNHDDEYIDAIASSPVMVIKDSQRSLGRTDEECVQISGTDEAYNDNQTQGASSHFQMQASVVRKNVTPSPTKHVRIQSSPPGSQHVRQPFSPQGNEPLVRARSASVSSSTSSNPPVEAVVGEADGMQSSIFALQNDFPKSNKAPTLDARDKSSSMPSRVAETPVHRRPRQFGDVRHTTTTIPETSPNNFQNQGWTSDTNNEAVDQEDDDLPPIFSRAHERTTQSQPIVLDSSSPIKPLFNSKILSSPSGRQRRALTEIASDASPHLGTGALDIDFNILSADDREFRSAVAMSPIPPRKKRRGNDGHQICASDPVLPVTPRATSYLAPLRETEEVAAPSPPQPAQLINKPGTNFRRASKPPRNESIWDTEDLPKFRASKKERSKMLAGYLGKERQAKERQAKERQTPERSEPVKPVVSPATSPTAVAASTATIAPPAPPTIPSPASPTVAHNTIPAAVSNVAAPELAQTLQEATTPPINQAVACEGPSEREFLSTENPVIACNQVLAPWNGPKRAYYPATCFGKPFGISQSRYLVKFEDSSPVEVPDGGIKRLEFRIGDAVKVDMPNVPKVTHIIRGFADKLSVDDLEKEAAKGIIPVTDVYGHSTVILGPKQRKSLPSGGLTGPETHINVPISRIYLDTILWNQLKDRAFTFNSVSRNSDSRLHTPSDRYSTPTSPSTRLSRSFRYSKGLFSGMIFAVSYGDNSEAKSRVTRMILENDGRILEDGFTELFEVSLNAPLATPTKTSQELPGSSSHLRLASSVEDMGFACLIADRHSRRPKYMQALALNLPCLSDRWVEDCVRKGQVVDWEMYLLPAGESSYLNGATKSRVLVPYPATKARLSETVAGRPNLLNGQSVLLITGRNGKADEEKRKAYIFLTYALGASRIERVPDVQSARAVLNQQQAGADMPSWDWIYIDDDDKTSHKAIGVGGPASVSAPSKKRRKSKLLESIDGNDLGWSSNIRIVGNEFVCQSLILGRLVDY